ncbi:MAG: alpha/beta hydrolase [Planctomycetota bacterium]
MILPSGYSHFCRNLSVAIAASAALLAATAIAQESGSPAKSASTTASKKSEKRRPSMPDEVYRVLDERKLHLDLYYPRHKTEAKHATWPTIVWIHGGGWHKGSKENCPITWLCGHGYVVASVEYRLTDEAQWPSQLEDCRAAVQYLREQASKYGLDADHIGACGGSAGGHLVATMATVDLAESQTSQAVQAVCDFYGPTDLLTMPNNVASAGKTREQLASVPGAKLLGGIVSEQVEKAKGASAWWQATKGDVPMLLVHGDADEQVPVEQSQRLYKKLQSVGVESELLVVPGAGHGMKPFNNDDVHSKVVQFFDRYLKP